MNLLNMILKRQHQAQKLPHKHYLITCGNPACAVEFSLCTYGGFPCMVICPGCHIKLVFWEE